MKPTHWLRLEAIAWLIAALYAYRFVGGGWGLLALVFLIPDLGMLGYMAGPRAGAFGYNVCHFEGVPIALGAGFWWLGRMDLQWVALAWLVHIAVDRVMGYGFKFQDRAFKQTHLQD
jgi:hypothetical protein